MARKHASYIEKLVEKIKRLEAEIVELKKRPEVVVIDKLQYRTNRSYFRGWSSAHEFLRPGEKYIIEVVVSHQPEMKYRFETPMMLVETPKVIVSTQEHHTSSNDDIIATEMRYK